jgi:NAD(P)-dependent dehydrogenase (short-subunit alcohol dehydrogenase family)
MSTVLITGANRGIGYEFVRQYAGDGWRVLACCREPARAEALRAVKGAVSIHPLDVTQSASVLAAKMEIGSEPIDLLINNAGFIGQRAGKLGHVDYDDWNVTLNVNLLGPARVSSAFVANVLASRQKKLVTISTRMSSFTECKAIDFLAYRTSKAAVNMMTKLAANELGPQGATVVLLHPGWVKTELGGPRAVTPPTESVSAMRAVIDRLTPGDNGCFINFDGSPIPW